MEIHGTTICAVRKGNQVAIAGDGQATSGEGGMVIKGNCRKVRRLYNGKIIIGFVECIEGGIEKTEDVLSEYESQNSQNKKYKP